MYKLVNLQHLYMPELRPSSFTSMYKLVNSLGLIHVQILEASSLVLCIAIGYTI